MSARRAAVALALCVGVVAALPGRPVQATPGPGTRAAFLFLIDRTSFEQLLRVPELAALARAGGAGLMHILPEPGDRGLGPWLTIGAGAGAAVPFARVDAHGLPSDPGTELSSAQLAALKDANHDGAVPGLLGGVLRQHGVPVTFLGGPTGPALLTAMDERGVVPRVGPGSALAVSGAGTVGGLWVIALPGGPTLASDAEVISAVGSTTFDRVLIIVATPSPSADMTERGDVVTPVIVASGPPPSLFTSTGPMRGLTSTSTRQQGLVAGDDIAPTILSFFGIVPPAEMTGAVIQADGMAPFALHRRELELRQIRIPISAGLGVGGLALFLILAALLASRRRWPQRGRAVAGFVLVAWSAVPLALLETGLLPHLTYAWVVPVAVAILLGAGALAWPLRRIDPGLPVTVVAGVVAAAIVIDGVIGWRASATSFGGVTVFEGRSYGIRNFYLGPFLAGLALVGARLRPRQALVLVLAGAVFAGWPNVGANVGACATLLAAGPLLFFRLLGRRIRLREGVWTVATMAVGLAAMFAADALLNPTPTHAGRFAERVASTGPGTLVHEVLDRLASTVRLIDSVPPAWLLVGLLFLTAWLAMRARGEMGIAFDLAPGYRAGLWTLAVGSLVAIAVNDTGISTALGASSFVTAGLLSPLLAMHPQAAEGIDSPRRAVRT